MLERTETDEFIGVKYAGGNLNKKLMKNELIIMYDEYSCDICHNNGVDQSIRRAFKVNYCTKCKGKLKLISQSTAIKEYLVSKDDLKRLQKIEVPNPKNEGWRPMLLYSKEEVERVSKEKYPDVDEEKVKRDQKKKEKGRKQLMKKLSLLKRHTRPKISEEKAHVHKFNSNG